MRCELPQLHPCQTVRRRARFRGVSATGRKISGNQLRAPATLGDLLYAARTKPSISEDEWVALLRAIADGDQGALHALYDRAHRVAFTLIMRITHDRQIAEELTLDVFHDVWRRASQYEAESGTVLGWIMNQARSRAIDRVRFQQRKKRVNPHGDNPLEGNAEPPAEEAMEQKQRARVVQRALEALTPDEREAIETAYFSELTYAEAAARLNQPLGTVKTRIRSGLAKLREALEEGTKQS